MESGCVTCAKRATFLSFDSNKTQGEGLRSSQLLCTRYGFTDSMLHDNGVGAHAIPLCGRLGKGRTSTTVLRATAVPPGANFSVQKYSNHI